MNAARRQRRAVFAALAMARAARQPEQVQPELYERLPWGTLAPRFVAALLMAVVIGRPRLTAALMRLGMVGPGKNVDKTTFHWSATARPPSVANISRSLDFGSGAVAPELFAVADGAGGFTDESANGYVCTVGGTGTAPSDISAYCPVGNATRFAAGQHIAVAGLAVPGTDDIVIRVVHRTNGSGGDICGWVDATASRHLAFGPISGTNLAGYVKGATATLTAAQWAYGIGEWQETYFTHKAGAGWRRITNTTQATQINGTAGTIDAGTFAIGGDIRDTAKTSCDVALVAVYRTSLSSTDLSAVASPEYALLTGQSALRSKGTATPTLATRSDSVLLRKEHSTLGTLWIPGAANWPAIEHNSAGVVGYAPSASSTFYPVNNHALTSWTAAGTASASAETWADGTSRATLAAGLDPSNFLLGSFLWAAGASPSFSDSCVGVVVQRKTGETGTLRVFDYNNANHGDWRINLSLLTVGKWEWITVGHAALTVTKSWVDGPSNHYVAIGSTDSIGTVNVLVTMTQATTVTRPVLVGAAARTTGAETRHYTEDALNVPQAGCKITVDVTVRDHDAVDAVLAQISDGGGSAEILQVRVEGTGDYAAATSTTGSGVVADVQGTTDIADGVRRTIVARFATNNTSLLVAGAAEGTPDTSCALPTGLDRIEFGVADAHVHSVKVERL